MRLAYFLPCLRLIDCSKRASSYHMLQSSARHMALARQARDLVMFLLISLDLVQLSQRGCLLQTLATLASAISQTQTVDDVYRLIDLRREFISFLILLLQLSSSSPLAHAEGGSSPSVDLSAHTSGSFVCTSPAVFEGDAWAEVEHQLSIVLDAVKTCVSRSSGDVELAVSSRSDQV